MMTLPVHWSRIISSPRLYRSSHALSVIGQKAFIFGGEIVPRQPVENNLDVLEFRDREALNITTIPMAAEAPRPLVGSPSTTINDSIWLFSGRGGLEMRPIEENGALWRFDNKKGTWNLIRPSDPNAPYPAGRSYHCITSDNEDCIYVHSGCPEIGRLSDLWVFSLQMKSWTQLPSAPQPARGGASLAYSRKKLYRINGFDGTKEQGGTLDVFDITTSTWSTREYNPDGSQGPSPRSVGCLLPITLKGRLYLVTMFGERDPSALGHAGAGKMLSDAWAWDLEHENWHLLTVTGDHPEPRGWFAADVVKDGTGGYEIIVHGGLSEENKRLGDVWKLTFS